MIKAFANGLILLVSMFFIKAAHADTFQVYNLGVDSNDAVGINDAGIALLISGHFCSDGNPSCYQSFQNGNLVSQSDTFPSSFISDNGVSCNYIAPTGYTLVQYSVCNGSAQVVVVRNSFDSGDTEVRELAAGSNTAGDLVLRIGEPAGVFVNPSGDVLFTDGDFGFVYQAIAQTPEPSTFFMMGTGILGMVRLMRRRHS
ncbi:PEP-CTERM sorting domain-containing protein [Tunturiibacter lichenicola]|jgi:PEP-CTERM motif|uniref:PEP-CTERM sorting domain-containing protein n=1 Tax=Tunturiibacter lichenicola TaxID=2051959 RepID=UPI003D9BF07E